MVGTHVAHALLDAQWRDVTTVEVLLAGAGGTQQRASRTAPTSLWMRVQRGIAAPVTEPREIPPLSMAEVAAEPPETSVARERQVVGDEPDTGELVPPESAQ